MKCSQFNSNDSLRSIFVTAELRPFRSGLPEAASKTERIDNFLAFVLDKRLSDGRSVLLIFLETLRDRYLAGDALRDELTALLADIKQHEAHPNWATSSVDNIASGSNISKESEICPGIDVPSKEQPLSSLPDYNAQNLVVLATAVLGFLTGVLGNLLAGWIQQDILRNTFTSTSIISIVLLTIAGLIAGVVLRRFTKPTKIKKSLYWGFTVLVTGMVIIILVLAWRNVIVFPPEPPTVYYIIDATEKMAPLFDEVLDLAQATIVGMPDKARVGLRVYGGQLSEIAGCRDSTQLLELNTYEHVSAILNAVLTPIQPRGNGGLTGAVLETLYDDLAEETDPIRLLIITSGVDYQCELPESGILESRASDIKSDIDIIIFSIGNLDLRTQEALDNYATAFGGKHFNRKTPADLRPAIETFVNRGSNYLVEYPPTPPAQ